MRIIFIGQNGPFTLIPLQAVAQKHQIVGIVESAPRNYQLKSRQKRDIKEWIIRLYRNTKFITTLESIALKKEIPYLFLTREKQKELIQFITELNPDIICVASMSQLLKREAYSLPKYGTINFHPSLLPNYRGPNPLFWEYYYMEKEVGATIHFIDDGEDTGDIIKQGKINVELGMLPNELMNSVIRLGARLLIDALIEIENGTVNAVAQNHIECPHRARNIDRQEKLIDWENWSLERVWHVVRGTSVWLDSLHSPIPGLFWTVKNYSRKPCESPWGKRRFSLNGWYISHPQGRIKIRPHISIKSLVKELL